MSTEAYWLDTIARQARQAVAAWSESKSVDADMLSLQKHLRELDRVQHGRTPKLCPVCGEPYINAGAHADACRGPRP